MRNDLDIQGPGADARLAFEQSGQGPDVLLIHGALTTAVDMTLALTPALAGLRVTAVDRPGHGRSPPSSGIETPWRQAERIHDLVVELGLDRPVVVGHSFGGAVALAYAIRYPAETSGAVLLAPIVFPEIRMEHGLFAPRALPLGRLWNRTLGVGFDGLVLPLIWRAMFLPQVMPQAFRDRFPFDQAAARASLEAEGGDALAINRGLGRILLEAPACRTPVRIFAGAADPVVNNALHGLRLSGMLPDAAFRWLPGLRHMIHHFAQAPIAAAVRDLVQARQEVGPSLAGAPASTHSEAA